MLAGMFIAFEGLDGSGGTTQIGLYEAALRSEGRAVRRTREPSDGPVGALIRAQLASGVVGDAVFGLLFAADRRDHLDRVVLPALEAGEVGYVIAGIRELQAAKVGDTITLIKPGTGGAAFTATQALPGFKEIQPQVFAGLYPTEANQYEGLRDSLEKLKLNDSSLHYEPEVSQALGFGFRCGFLGLLHMEIVQERLEREFDQDLITTAPSVVYQVVKADGSVVMVENPSKLPDQSRTEEIREPIVTVRLYMPQEYVGGVMTLANQKRGVQLNMSFTIGLGWRARA